MRLPKCGATRRMLTAHATAIRRPLSCSTRSCWPASRPSRKWAPQCGMCCRVSDERPRASSGSYHLVGPYPADPGIWARLAGCLWAALWKSAALSLRTSPLWAVQVDARAIPFESAHDHVLHGGLLDEIRTMMCEIFLGTAATWSAVRRGVAPPYWSTRSVRTLGMRVSVVHKTRVHFLT